MKKAIIICLIICLTICGLPISSSAANPYNFSTDNKDITIVYNGNSLSDEKLQSIAVSLLNGGSESDSVSTCSVLCVFGHKLEYSKAYLTDHNYYTTSPFCRESEYEVEICTRDSCSYMKNTLVRQYRISSCHG